MKIDIRKEQVSEGSKKCELCGYRAICPYRISSAYDFTRCPYGQSGAKGVRNEA